MILDTNAVSALLAGDPALEHVLAVAPRHELPVIVIGEYRYGLRRSRERHKLAPLMELLIRESTVLPIEVATAEVYAELRERLRVKGTPIPENDIWIGALALEHDLAIVSRDADFDHVVGLRRVSW